MLTLEWNDKKAEHGVLPPKVLLDSLFHLEGQGEMEKDMGRKGLGAID